MTIEPIPGLIRLLPPQDVTINTIIIRKDDLHILMNIYPPEQYLVCFARSISQQISCLHRELLQSEDSEPTS